MQHSKIVEPQLLEKEQVRKTFSESVNALLTKNNISFCESFFYNFPTTKRTLHILTGYLKGEPTTVLIIETPKANIELVRIIKEPFFGVRATGEFFSALTASFIASINTLNNDFYLLSKKDGLLEKRCAFLQKPEPPQVKPTKK